MTLPTLFSCLDNIKIKQKTFGSSHWVTIKNKIDLLQFTRFEKTFCFFICFCLSQIKERESERELLQKKKMMNKKSCQQYCCNKNHRVKGFHYRWSLFCLLMNTLFSVKHTVSFSLLSLSLTLSLSLSLPDMYVAFYFGYKKQILKNMKICFYPESVKYQRFHWILYRGVSSSFRFHPPSPQKTKTHPDCLHPQTFFVQNRIIIKKHGT